MDPVAFAAKWMASTRNERAAAQEHFIDLCRMLGVPTPNEADPTGDFYAFEKGAGKLAGGEGFADVWKRDFFAWEYKGKKKDLAAAFRQLVDYKDALENPPILVVCDLDRFEVRTNFTRLAAVLYTFDLAQLEREPAEPLRILRALMTDPEELKPRGAAEELTAETRTTSCQSSRSSVLVRTGLTVVTTFGKLRPCLTSLDPTSAASAEPQSSR